MRPPRDGLVPVGPAPGAGKTDIAIRTADLSKRYGEVTAVEGLDLEVRRGEVYGFLGRNGAGKTTTIRMLVGLVRPSRGQVRVFGQDVRRQRLRAAELTGSLVETATGYPNLTTRENLDIQRRIRHAPADAVDRVLALLGLEELADRRAGHLSLGNRQRLALARALLAEPRLLVLDEPANALDPAGIVEIRRLLRRLADERGVTVFVSSHILAEVTQLADRIGIIHRGRLVEEIAMASFRDAARLELEVSEVERARTVLAERLGLEAAATAAGRLQLACADVPAATVVRTLVEHGIEVSAACPQHEDLEARFLRLTGEAA